MEFSAKAKIFSIIFLSFVISSCSKVTYEKIKTSVEENCFEKTEKLLLKCNSLTEDEMLELADISFQKNYSFDIIRLLCEKGLDVNSRITDNSSKTPKPQSFIYLAMKYDDEQFVDYIISKGLTSKSFYIDGSKDLIEFALTNSKGKYFEKVWNAVKENDICRVNLFSLLMPVSNSSEKIQDMFYTKKGVVEALKANPAFTLFLISNYKRKSVEIIKKYMTLDGLDFSDNSICLKYAIDSGDLDTVKWVISNGVSTDVKLELFEEPVSIEEYIDYSIEHQRRMGSKKESLIEIKEYLLHFHLVEQ